MTRPSNADLREALERILIDGFADQDLSNNEKVSAMTNTLLKLFQAREQQLLTELLGAAIDVNTDDDVNVPVVPVSVIKSKIGELNG